LDVDEIAVIVVGRLVLLSQAAIILQVLNEVRVGIGEIVPGSVIRECSRQCLNGDNLDA
jgi:hypothetical protein